MDSAAAFAQKIVAGATTPPDRIPLVGNLWPPEPFPVNALGPLEPAAKAIFRQTQAPPAICAQAVLAVATTAAQHIRDVELPTGQQRPISCYFLSSALSGERKSTADEKAGSGLRQREGELRPVYDRDYLQYKNAVEALETKRAEIKRINKNDRAALEEALNNEGPEPTPPLAPIITLTNVTAEGIINFSKHQLSFALMSDEGGQIFGGHAFSDDHKMRTAATFNSAWDGASIKQVRADREKTFFLSGRRITMHVMAQPIVLSEVLADNVLQGSGFLPRCLTVSPQSAIGTRQYKNPPPEAAIALHAFDQRILDLLRRPPVLGGGGLAPPPIGLSPEATRAWIDFYDEIETKQRPGGELSSITGFASKAAEHAGRLAAVLTVFDNPDAPCVPLVAMECGIVLARHYINEMLRLREHAKVSAANRDAQELVDWWRRQDIADQYPSRIQQFGPPCVRSKQGLDRCIRLLVEHGYARELDAGIILDGAPRKRAWTLIPE